MNATLDISEPQVLVNFPLDVGGFFWHHRVLLHRIADGRWVCLTPDYPLIVHDLAQLGHRVLQRRRGFPDDIAAECYVHDPIDAVTLRGLKRDAKLQAALLGDVAPERQGVGAWFVSDPRDALFGQEVPEEVVADADVTSTHDEKRGDSGRGRGKIHRLC